MKIKHQIKKLGVILDSSKRHGETAFHYYAPSLWNSLPENLKGLKL
jgi:hypothetical protein